MVKPVVTLPLIVSLSGRAHASLLLKQGVRPKVVQERLGHSSVAVALGTYSHVTPGLQEAAALRFDGAFIVGHNSKANEKVR